jgi:hypothetical protein
VLEKVGWLNYNYYKSIERRGSNMAKSDKLKEELAESRHEEIIGIMLGTFGVAALSLAVAFGVWQWQQNGSAAVPSTLFGLLLIIGFGYWAVCSLASRRSRNRKKKIQQLDNKE